MGPKTIIFNHGDKALNVSSFSLSQKTSNLKNNIKIGCGPKVGYFGHIF